MRPDRPLKVLIDARMLLGRFSGVARFVTRLVDHLALRKDVRVSVLCGDEVHEPWRDRTDIAVITSSFSRADRTPSRRRRWEARNLDRIIRAADVDVFHATWNTGVPPRSDKPTVLTVHDLIPWQQPVDSFSARRERWHYRRAQSHAIARATLITTVSDYVRRQVVSQWPARSALIQTVPNGVDLPTEIGSNHDPVLDSSDSNQRASDPFVLYVGGHESRKNLEGLIHAMDAYWQAFEEPLTLKLTGTPDTLTPAARRALDGVRHRERIVFLGKVDEPGLQGVYERAVALLFLSRDEGFGLPALEAMAHGCPVIASNRASLPEVVGDAGLLVGPDNPTEAADALHRIRTDSLLRSQLRSRGLDRAVRFSWSATAEGMLATYRAALEIPERGADACKSKKTQATHPRLGLEMTGPPGLGDDGPSAAIRSQAGHHA